MTDPFKTPDRPTTGTIEGLTPEDTTYLTFTPTSSITRVLFPETPPNANAQTPGAENINFLNDGSPISLSSCTPSGIMTPLMLQGGQGNSEIGSPDLSGLVGVLHSPSAGITYVGSPSQHDNQGNRRSCCRNLNLAFDQAADPFLKECDNFLSKHGY